MKPLLDRFFEQGDLMCDALQDIKDKNNQTNMINAEYHFIQVARLGIEFFGEDCLKGAVLVPQEEKFIDKAIDQEGVA